MPNFFSYYFLLWSIPILQEYIFILRKTNTMPKKVGAEKFHNYIIYYADSLRHYWTANTILYYFILLRFLLLYYTHTHTHTRARVYYYYYITLFFFAFFFSYYSIFFFIILYSYTFADPRKIEPKQIIYGYIFYLLIYPPKHFLSLLILHN